MRLGNITAVMQNDARILKNSKWHAIEMFYFPVFNTLIWGFFSTYSKQYSAQAGLIVLIVNMFWTFTHLAQQEANMLVMEDLWSLSIKHVFTSGVTPFEYLFAKLASSAFIAIIVTSLLIFIANAFGAPLYLHLAQVIAISGVALIGSLALATLVSGTVLMLGKEYAFLSWSTLELFVFFSAPFYDPSILPKILQVITTIMPFTAVFAAARALATNTPLTKNILLSGLYTALAYFALTLIYYHFCIKHARKSGKLARISS